MSSALNGELNSFHRFTSEQLSIGRGDVSPEEVLDLWRAKHPLSAIEEEDLLAVREALADMANGDSGMPLEQFDREFRQRHGSGTSATLQNEAPGDRTEFWFIRMLRTFSQMFGVREVPAAAVSAGFRYAVSG